MDTNNSLFTNKTLRTIVLTLGALLVVLVAVKIVAETKSLSYISGQTPNVINVTGKGEILATPDVASFTFGVTEEAASVPEAQKEATDKMNAILAYVKDAGIDEKDIKTTSYNIYPRYNYLSSSAYYPGGRQVLAAYVVSQMVEVKIRTMNDAGKIISGIGEHGATDISGLTFSVDEIDEATREARDKAIEDARDQAEILARSLGVSLGKIVSFSESTPGYPYPIYYAKDAMGMGGAVNQASSPELPGGESKIVSNVSITYEIK